MLAPQAFIAELEPTVARLLERHLSTSKEWFPHEVVPWRRGRDFSPGATWDESDGDVHLPDEVRSSLFVNLLTEDNLPYYFRTIEFMFGRDGAWGEWNRRWTAEEDQQIADWLAGRADFGADGAEGDGHADVVAFPK